MQRVSLLVAIYSVVHLKINGSLEKHYKVKKWNIVKPQGFFLRALLKMYVVHWGTLKFALLLFTTRSSILNTRSLVGLFAMTQDVFPGRSLRLGNSNLWSITTTGECLCTCYVNPRPACGPVSFSILCTYNETTAWL